MLTSVCLFIMIFFFLEINVASRMGFLKGKPLYLDTQSTTPLVSIISIIIFFLTRFILK